MSHYRVGAALLTRSGEVVPGCNVEHVVLHETACAEKVAILSAVAAGHHEFEACAVATHSEPPASPCGSCRQMLSAWGVKRILLVNTAGQTATLDIDALLPRAFTPEDL